MKIRFLKAVTLPVTETKTIDGKLVISEFTETMRINKNVWVTDIFPGKDVSHINFQTQHDDTIKLYQDADLSMLTIHQGTPEFMIDKTPVSVPTQPKPCGGCPGK